MATVVAAGYSTSRASEVAPGRVVGALALGVNVGAWDRIYRNADPTTIADLLRSAGLRLMRYPGGGWADQYDWRTNTDSSACLGAATSACIAVDPFGFGDFSAASREAAASTFVTVNYGSGTPKEAAAWVRQAATTKHEAVALWEVGNETYSCDETNQHLAGAPTFVQGYAPNSPVCPSTAVMARSYAANVLPYLKAMQRASKQATIDIGVPWAFSGYQAAGAGVKKATAWNTTVLRAVKGRIGFVDAHWYPFDQITGLTDQQIVQSIRRIPAAAEQIRSTLHKDAPGARFVIGESNISERPTTLDFQPVSALFAAATSLAWLSQGAQSVDWWDLNNYGTPTEGDFGLVSSGRPETEAAGTMFPAYFGEELASKLATVGSRVQTVRTGSTNVVGFQSDLASRREILLVNAAPSATPADPARWFASGAHLGVVTYSATPAADASPLVDSAATAGQSLLLPAQSIVVLTGTVRS
jgi:hypothetical protein